MRILAILLVGLLSVVGLAHSNPLPAQLESVLENSLPGEKIPVIIELVGQAEIQSYIRRGKSVRQMNAEDRRVHRSGLIRTLRERGRQSQTEVARFLRSKGVVAQKSLWITNSIAAQVSAEDIRQLADMPEVVRVRADTLVSLPRIIPAASGGIEDNLLAVHVPYLWSLGYEGEGRVVALLDTGVDYLHPDLLPVWRGGSNSWFNPVAADCARNPVSCSSCDRSATIPCDYVDSEGIAHGTGVAGIMVGGDAGGTSIGVAPQAKWIAAKIFKSDDSATTSNIHLAFQWVLDPDGDPETDDAPDVVNSSWALEATHSCVSEYRQDVRVLEASGIAAVFAAGNSGPADQTDESPANYPESLAVGSVGTHASSLAISDFSGRGPSRCDEITFNSGAVFPEVVAPGFSVKTTDFSRGGSARYIFLGGTSFSAPHVAGIVALLSEAFPRAPLEDIEDAITLSAQDLGARGPDNTYGNGLINATAAYDWLLEAPNLAITDPVVPANDQQVDYGTLAPSAISQKTIVCANSGRGELQIGQIRLAGASVFSLVGDSCSSQILTGGQSCQLVVSFSSATGGTYSASLFVPSNDLDQPELSVALAGLVSGPSEPAPQLAVVDSISPTADRNLPFGVVLVGNQRAETIEVSNNDQGELVLGVLDKSALNNAFSVTSDSCSQHTLIFGQRCLIGIEFAPASAGQFTGSLSLSSNDSTSPSRIFLSGAGNNLPPAPVLITPTPGQTGLSTTVEFSWRQFPDPDGDILTTNLYFSTDPVFSGVVPIQVALKESESRLLLAGIGGMLLTGLLVRAGNMPGRLKMALLLACLVLVGSCSGGGGGGEGGSPIADPDPQVHSSFQAELLPGAMYYWKVSVDDGKGSPVESEVAQFRTQ